MLGFERLSSSNSKDTAKELQKNQDPHPPPEGDEDKQQECSLPSRMEF
jgi:hypothetical protein